jgi:hypothetical protein
VNKENCDGPSEELIKHTTKRNQQKMKLDSDWDDEIGLLPYGKEDGFLVTGTT